MLESFFNKVAGLQVYIIIKKLTPTEFSCEYCEIFKNTYFEKSLRTAASVSKESTKLTGQVFIVLGSVFQFLLLKLSEFKRIS